MALTRKFLSAMGLEGEKVDEIISAHAETVDALKEERDKARQEAAGNREAAAKLEAAEKELGELKEKIKEGSKDPFEPKYEALKKEYDEYKAEIAAREEKAKKGAAYRELLKEAKVADDWLDTIMQATDLGGVSLDEDGNLADREKLSDGIRQKWARCIQEEGVQGARTPTPPVGTGGGGQEKPSRAALRAMKYKESLYGKVKEG